MINPDEGQMLTAFQVFGPVATFNWESAKDAVKASALDVLGSERRFAVRHNRLQLLPCGGDMSFHEQLGQLAVPVTHCLEDALVIHESTERAPRRVAGLEPEQPHQRIKVPAKQLREPPRSAPGREEVMEVHLPVILVVG